MKAQGATSLLVQDGARVGIFTATDMREALAQGADPTATPLARFATFDLVTVGAQETLATALALMSERSIQRLVVVRDGEITGVLEQVRLLSFLADHSLVVATRIGAAQSLAELKTVVARIDRLLDDLFRGGIHVEPLARLVSGLHRRVYARLFDLVVPAPLHSQLCLVVMGSEGRGEQLLRTDQDNGLIGRDGISPAELASAGTALSDTLEALGWPPCPGGVMARNPQWAKPLSVFREEIASWVRRADGAAVLDLAIFLDATPVAGHLELLTRAKERVLALARANDAFCAKFAQPVEMFGDALGFLSRLRLEKKGEHRGMLDLKKAGLFPVVHGVRSLALHSGLTETNTFQRTRQLEHHRVFDQRFGEALRQTYETLLALRLKVGLECLRSGGVADNYVAPQTLTPLERYQLKESLRVVRELKEIVRYHFRLHSLF
jgi:CBS domain-containing protein